MDTSQLHNKCPICGNEMHPTDSLESPITGALVSPNYECPDNCEYIEWMKERGRLKSMHHLV